MAVQRFDPETVQESENAICCCGLLCGVRILRSPSGDLMPRTLLTRLGLQAIRSAFSRARRENADRMACSPSRVRSVRGMRSPDGDRKILTPHNNPQQQMAFSDSCTVSGSKRCTAIPSIWETYIA